MIIFLKWDVNKFHVGNKKIKIWVGSCLLKIKMLCLEKHFVWYLAYNYILKNIELFISSFNIY